MSVGDLLWFGFILLFIYPYIIMWWLDRKRELFMRTLGRKEHAQVITMIHASGGFSLLGLPFMRMIDLNDLEEVLDAIRQTPKNKPIDVVLHVTGGAVLAAAQIAKALKSHPARTRVIVPYYAMSGGTLIAMGADEIIMADNAVLGPLDPQILTFKGPLSVQSLRKVASKKGKSADDETLMLAVLGEQAVKQIQDTIIELLKDRIGGKKAATVADYMTRGDKTHDYAISPMEAKKIGLNVKVGIRPEVYKLMDTYRIYRKGGIDVLYK